MIEDIQGFITIELVLLSSLFEVQKGINPFAIIVKGEDRFLVPLTYKNATHKDIVSQGLKDLVRTMEPDAIVYAAEAWIKLVKSVNDEMPTSLADDPDRGEILMVQIEFKSGEKYSCMANIIREKEDVKLSQFDIKSSEPISGRFCDFYPPRTLN